MSDSDGLRVARAQAIEGYAKLESELCYLFSALLGSRHDTAAIVFFKIVSAGSRTAIISDLIEHVHGSKYDVYWYGEPGGGGTKKVPGLFRLINLLDKRRNEIVHWHVVSSAVGGIDGTTHKFDDLRPPFFLARSNAPPIAKRELDAFCDMAEFTEQSIRKFWLVTRHPQKFTEAELKSWNEIFRRPVPYPPSPDHPFYKATRT